MKIYMKIFYSSIFFHSVATGFGTYMWKVNTAPCPWCHTQWHTQWHPHNDTQRRNKQCHTMTQTSTHTNTHKNIHMKTHKHTRTRWHTTNTYTYNGTHLHTNYHTNLLTYTMINTHSISLRMFHYVSLCEILLVYIISFVFVLFVLLWAWSRACNF